MTVLLQVSDTHFGTERLPVVDALVRLAQDQRPDLVVLSGDITQRARRSQFQAARAFLDRLGVPWLVIPGNHDIPLFDLRERLLRPHARHCETFGADLEPVHDSPELLVLGVNTTRWYRHRNGEVSAAQIERVAQRLEQAGTAQLRVVVVHQPMAVLHARDVPHLLRGHRPALRRWSAAGCDLVMGGHIHLPYVTPYVTSPVASQAMPSITPDAPSTPRPSHPMWILQAGTAVSARVRDGVPNSVHLLRWGSDAAAGRCRVERWDCAATGPAFHRAAVDELTPCRQDRGRRSS